MVWINRILALTFVICMISSASANGQPQLALDVELSETLTNSQSINVQSLLSSVTGPNLFQLYLRNESTSEHANNLYFNIVIESNNIGEIVRFRQVSGQPFHLSPGQQVNATNNSMSNGLPGVEEVIQLKSNFTQAGQDFINNLQGATSLPADQYRVRVEIYQGSISGNPVASTMAEMGTSIVEDTRDFYLLSPGDVIGSGSIINNTYPNFQWQGATGTKYRLVVVESKANDSPQSLLDGAVSTNPIQTNGSSNSGSLVDYEMLDVEINQSSFQYPSSGVQNLEPGKQYYWRVIAQLETSSGVETRESEIWSFSLPQTSSQQASATQGTENSAQVNQALKQILGNEFQGFTQGNMEFQSIEVYGQTLQGAQAIQKLMELSRRAEQGDISIVIEEQ